MLKISEYITAIQSDKQFTCLNYGDGEWSCILGLPGGNCNGEDYLPELGSDLRETMVHPRFTAFGYNAGRNLDEDAKAWLHRHECSVPLITDDDLTIQTNEHGVDIRETKINWVHKQVMPSANVHGEFAPLLNAIKGMKKLLVSGRHLRNLDVIGDFRHLIARGSNAYVEVDQLFDRLMRCADDREIILFSCGMCSNVLAYRLLGAGYKGHILDMGASLDPYVGLNSRIAYRKPAFQAMLKKNIEELK